MNNTTNQEPSPLSGRPRGGLPISPQGWPFLIGGAILTLVAWLLCWHTAAAILFLLLLFMLNFFRDPERDTPRSEGLFISPADGKVVRAEQTRDGVRVDIFMNVFNVHVNRAPMAGRITHMQYTRGRFINAAHDHAGEHNERNRFEMQTDAGHALAFTQVAGLVARRIVSYIAVGDHVTAGQRIGMIRFGSRVNCELPAGFTLKVRVGDKVSAGLTVLAILAKENRTDEHEQE
jgi:phosphatidylserine decarboxylase